jgi:AraC-like DNA-binding protein
MVVKDELKNLGLHPVVINLGMVHLHEDLCEPKRSLLKKNLNKCGLDLLDSKQAILVEKIKNAITELIHYSEEVPKENYSSFLSQKLGYDYTYLANTFSEVKGMTIQHYIIIHKIEMVKELILYNELSLTEIAYKLHYSSVAHLSAQFKKVTGCTPTAYKKAHHERTHNLENL